MYFSSSITVIILLKYRYRQYRYRLENEYRYRQKKWYRYTSISQSHRPDIGPSCSLATRGLFLKLSILKMKGSTFIVR